MNKKIRIKIFVPSVGTSLCFSANKKRLYNNKKIIKNKIIINKIIL